jgi:hypothetical protein
MTELVQAVAAGDVAEAEEIEAMTEPDELVS